MRLELVTSGRSVEISEELSGQRGLQQKSPMRSNQRDKN
jgi:hypothetical protein